MNPRTCPASEQESLLSCHAGCTRSVWDKALDLQKRRLKTGCRSKSTLIFANL
ncbi:MAG: helix-turn-helix domain-containing protein [Leptospirales bacterium]